MNDQITGHLRGLTLGGPQTFHNIVIFPLSKQDSGMGVAYITLAEALDMHTLSVTEISQGGSVPELKVVNSSDTPVLLLDGEELAGSKQNRVLNTTVLVPERESIVIPVSCTEQGRWTYNTPTFQDSGTVMARSIRARKNRSVSDSLSASSSSFRSDQGEVWEGISDLQEAAAAPSPTTAMRDVFESQQKPLDEALAAFSLCPHQTGLLAVIQGAAVGFDVVSRPEAYTRLHGKLVKSYAMDALLEKKGRKKKADLIGALKAAQDFLAQSIRCEEKAFKSVGLGDDYRFKGDHLAGSALHHAGTVIHAAFFQLDQTTTEGHMSDLHRRRSYRAY
jgi:hypothetical protein